MRRSGYSASWPRPRTACANSRWRLVDAGPNRLGIVSASSGLQLDAYNNSLSDGAAIIQWSGNNGANQKWTLVPAS
ncbi:RICIN domain-containing protein [Kutzneria kofuensis]|uniref:RICIN domain-containing protein n=1 Tax=Kutzneria kofuensis TaxID=103725 RepID=UPI0031ED6FFC